MCKALILLAVLVCAFSAIGQEVTQGSLFAVTKKGVELGACPLKHTSVKTDISGFVARVRVVQEFENSFTEPIEAVYTFPLSQNGAVDDMTMKIGDRTISGKIMKKEEARAAYETARSEGKTASLLDQERPNIFTQAIANIMPGDKVTIEISYVETLKYEDGAYEFVFPMTVGPRYIPGSVTDANKIKPPVAETRAGHDISVEVNLNAGVPVEEIRSSSHQIDQVNLSPNNAKVTLRGEKVIPNKDFILRYDVTGKKIEDAVLAHRDSRGGFFSLVLQPPDRFTTEDITPKEIVFVLDTSGSMSGFPIEKAKEAMKLSLEGLNPNDTFNLITFAGDTSVLFETPVPATQANLERAQAFLDTREGGGGTEMMKAIKTALDPSDSQEHLRIVCFMTDAYVGNDNEIIAEIQKHPKARVFSFGIGSSVNRALLDKMAEAGNGEVEYVSLTDDGSKAAKKFYERVRTPLLTDLSIDWNGMPVDDVYPSKLTDLFSAKPVIVNARYSKAASGTIKLRGRVAGQPYERTITLNLPDAEAANDVLATLWARRRVDELSMEALKGKGVEALNTQITGIGLEFRILTQLTSFVAVEEQVVNRNGTPTKVEVPVAIPEGVSKRHAGVSTSEIDQGSTVTGANISSEYFANIPAARTVQGLYSISPTVARSGMRDGSKVDRNPSVAGSSGPENSYVLDGTKKSTRASRRESRAGSGSGSGSGSGIGSGTGSGSGNGSTPPLPQSPPPTSSGDTPFRRMEIIATLQRRAVISGGVLNGKAVNLPRPAYPAAASAVKATGAVSVQVTIDESGKVISATPVSGHPLLRTAAAKAASAAKFTPTLLSGQPVKVTGIVTYNFIGRNKPATVPRSLSSPRVIPPEDVPPPMPTAEMIREWAIKEKLHSWVYSLMVRLRKGETIPGVNEKSFVRDGKASIQIVLTAKSQDALEKLKGLGFEGESAKDGVKVFGRIAVEKLGDLAEMDEVKFVLPQMK